VGEGKGGEGRPPPQLGSLDPPVAECSSERMLKICQCLMKLRQKLSDLFFDHPVCLFG